MRTSLCTISPMMMFVIVLIISCFYVSTYSAQYIAKYGNNERIGRAKRHLIDIQDPVEAIKILRLLAHDISNSEGENVANNYEKRGVDLGLSRGFSGNQAAKHLLGLSAANFASGPGRRKRSVTSDQFQKYN